MYISFIFK